MSVRFIWYVASVNFKQLSLGRNKFSDLHLLKYNPELSCSVTVIGNPFLLSECLPALKVDQQCDTSGFWN